jgi:integrase
MRVPKPYYRKQTDSYYVQLNGKQINLGKDEKQAYEQYHRLMANRHEPEPDIKVEVLLDRFLDWTKNNKAEATYEWYKGYLQSFKNAIGGTRPVSNLKVHHIQGWIDSYPTLGNRNCAVRAIKRAFNWGLEQEYITRSPAAKIKRPPLDPREVYITPQEWRTVLGMMKPSEFKDTCLFLRLTGCRPQEFVKLEARHFQGNCFVLERKESKGKRKRRVIPLPKAALKLVTPRLEKNPTGPLFRTSTGKPWTSDSLNSRFDDFEDKLNAGLDRKKDASKWVKFYPYAIRHTFITDALIAGIDPIKLAKIVGHKDLRMIMEVYAHLELAGKLKQGDYLNAEMEKLSEGDAMPSPAA